MAGTLGALKKALILYTAPGIPPSLEACSSMAWYGGILSLNFELCYSIVHAEDPGSKQQAVESQSKTTYFYHSGIQGTSILSMGVHDSIFMRHLSNVAMHCIHIEVVQAAG